MPNAALAAPIDQLDRVPRKTPLSPPRESALTQCCGLTTELSPSKREVGAPPGNRSSGGTISGASICRGALGLRASVSSTWTSLRRTVCVAQHRVAERPGGEGAPTALHCTRL